MKKRLDSGISVWYKEKEIHSCGPIRSYEGGLKGPLFFVPKKEKAFDIEREAERHV